MPPHSSLTPEALADLENALRTHFFARQPADYLETDRGLNDLTNHLTKRLQDTRNEVVPWLESVRDLRGARVLEIGCGTGSSVVALAERGAHVTGVDLDEGALQVARRRCELHDVVVELHSANATIVRDLFGYNAFDVIIFYASLEHMVLEERLQSIADTWAMLRPGALWCVIETPNRLWHTDTHTALLPFFHWLPDELAFRYARFSDRTNFRECYNEMTDERRLHFARRGRGVSYHELHVALGTPGAFEVVSYKNEFLARTDALSESYVKILKQLVPDIHEGFLQKDLDIVLRKPETSTKEPT